MPPPRNPYITQAPNPVTPGGNGFFGNTNFVQNINDLLTTGVNVANTVRIIEGKQPISINQPSDNAGGAIGDNPQTTPVNNVDSVGRRISDALYNFIPQGIRENMVRTAREDAINISIADAESAIKNNLLTIGLIGVGVSVATYFIFRK